MLSKEIQNKTGLSRKALEYYEDKGLIQPSRLENDYREYSQEDLQKLEKISLYRQLGLSVKAIKEILLKQDLTSLGQSLRKSQQESEFMAKRQALLLALVQGQDILSVKSQIQNLTQMMSLYDRLLQTFPGYLGQVFFSAYKPFLKEGVIDEEGFQILVDTIDQLPRLRLTEEEENYIEDMSKDIQLSDIDQIQEKKILAIEAPQAWLEKYQDWIDTYLDYKASKDYKDSIQYQLEVKVRNYMKEVAYYEKVTPLIRQLSPAYNDYYNRLLEADATFQNTYFKELG